MEDITIKIALANAIAESLWMKGLISNDELAKIKKKNAESLSLKNFEKTTGRSYA